MAWKGRKVIENAPDWYNTPFEDLDFEWSKEEEVEIERYCERILKNVEEEGGMTPKERFMAFQWCKDKDRMVVGCLHGNVWSTRTLDSGADAIKPIDVHRYPKLFVKAHLATMARFKLDFNNLHTINYGEDMWGGQSRMVDYGNPILVPPPPIKKFEDIEGMPAPDPMKDGLYPGYLWANREYRRIINKYNLPIPVHASICPGTIALVMMGMTGFSEFPMVLRRDPEVVKYGIEKGLEFLKKFGERIIDLAEPDAMYM